MIRKTFAIELRGFDEAAQTATYLLTNQSLDRDDEIILADGLDDSSYKNNPVWLWGHAHGGPPEYCLGHAVKWIREGDGWLFTVWYDIQNNPTAKLVFGLVGSQSLRAVSVGFIPLKVVVGGSAPEDVEGLPEDVRQLLLSGQCRCVYTKWEMLEGSNVHIGSNRQTVARALRSDHLSPDLRKFLREELFIMTPVTEEKNETRPIEVTVKVQESAAAEAGTSSAEAKKKCWDDYYDYRRIHPIVADVTSRLRAQADILAATLDPNREGGVYEVDAIPAIVDVLTAVVAQLQALQIVPADATDTGQPPTEAVKTVKAGRAISADNLSSMGTVMGHVEEGIRNCLKGMQQMDDMVTGAGGESLMPKDFPGAPGAPEDVVDPSVYDPSLAATATVASYVEQLNKLLLE